VLNGQLAKVQSERLAEFARYMAAIHPAGRLPCGAPSAALP